VISSISFPDAGIALLIAIITGSLYAAFLYFRENKFSSPHYATYILAFLRGFVVGLIIVLLFSPVIKSLKEEIKPPLIVMAQDVSYSLEVQKNQGFNDNWNNLGSSFAEDFNVKNVRFAGNTTEDTLSAAEKKSTNFSGLFKYVDENYADQNVGAVIMSTDGIFNEGSNPLYLDAFINTPLYIVALGDTTKYKDLMVSDVFYNKIVYLGDKFSLQIDIRALSAPNTASKLIVENNGKKVWEETIKPDSKEYFLTKNIELEALKVGISKYRITLIPLGDEKNKTNNYKDIYVEVLDGRQKILVLANSPHPDIAAIKQLIEQNKNYEAEVHFAGENITNIGKFDLAILHNLPSDKNTIKTEMSALQAKKTPLFFVVGMQTSLPQFNQVQELITISGNSKNFEEVQAEIATGFNAFTVTDPLKSSVKSFPPLLTPFGEYKTKSNTQVFSYQNIKKIKTNYPQLVFGELKGSRVAVFCGEGLWKWRMADFVLTQTYDQVGELLNKSLQWTSIKEDKRKFRVNPGKNIYRENEPIMVDAQLYNDNYELINEPDASLIIKSEENKDYTFTFSKSGSSYQLNAGMFPPGSYTIKGSVTHNNQLQTATNTFTVEAVDLENNDLVARHDVLRGLVEKYGGKVIRPDEIPALTQLIREDKSLKPSLFQSNITKSIIHFKWICFLILLLLGLEWFLRRYLGSY
jgi:hypothetical protein